MPRLGCNSRSGALTCRRLDCSRALEPARAARLSPRGDPLLADWRRATMASRSPGKQRHISGCSAMSTLARPIPTDATIVCPGDDLVSLYPDRLARAGIGPVLLPDAALGKSWISLPGTVMSDLSLIATAALQPCRSRPPAAPVGIRTESSFNTAFTLIVTGCGWQPRRRGHHHCRIGGGYSRRSAFAHCFLRIRLCDRTPAAPVRETLNGFFMRWPTTGCYSSEPAPM